MHNLLRKITAVLWLSMLLLVSVASAAEPHAISYSPMDTFIEQCNRGYEKINDALPLPSLKPGIVNMKPKANLLTRCDRINWGICENGTKIFMATDKDDHIYAIVIRDPSKSHKRAFQYAKTILCGLSIDESKIASFFSDTEKYTEGGYLSYRYETNSPVAYPYGIAGIYEEFDGYDDLLLFGTTVPQWYIEWHGGYD